MDVKKWGEIALVSLIVVAVVFHVQAVRAVVANGA